MRFCGIQLRAISQRVLQLLFCMMSLTTTLLKFLPHLPGANELKQHYRWICSGTISICQYSISSIWKSFPHRYDWFWYCHIKSPQSCVCIISNLGKLLATSMLTYMFSYTHQWHTFYKILFFIIFVRKVYTYKLNIAIPDNFVFALLYRLNRYSKYPESSFCVQNCLKRQSSMRATSVYVINIT